MNVKHKQKDRQLLIDSIPEQINQMRLSLCMFNRPYGWIRLGLFTSVSTHRNPTPPQKAGFLSTVIGPIIRSNDPDNRKRGTPMKMK